jgi:hypothetical protein
MTPELKARKPRLSPTVFMLALGAALAFDALSAAAASSVLERVWTDLAARPSGPFGFRFVLQPIMATIAGIHDGIGDAHTGRSPYFWTVLTDPVQRADRLREGLKSTSRIIALGLVMDAIYQLIVFRTFYPLEAIIIALALAFVPYLLIRGPVARFVRWREGHSVSGGTSR